MKIFLVAMILCLTVANQAAAQQIDFNSAAATDPAKLAKAMPDLARTVLAVYHDDDRGKYLEKLFRLQIVAGQYAEAIKSLRELRALQPDAAAPQARAPNIHHEIFALAKLKQTEKGMPFEEAFRQAFREVMGSADDRTSAEVIPAMETTLFFVEQDLKQALDQQKGKNSISLADALNLIRLFQIRQSYQSFGPLIAPLIDEDDSHRYIVDKAVQVTTPDKAIICAILMRPKKPTARLPAAMRFTIYADPNNNINDARRAASHGYAGVVGLTRGKGCSPNEPIPYENDGADADALIDWISKQAWSDGRVAMYGGSYEGFTQWAAAKHLPEALKTIVPYVANNPGDGLPMENNVFLFVNYAWARVRQLTIVRAIDI